MRARWAARHMPAWKSCQSARTALPIGSRMCCAFLARLVAEHRLCEVEAHELAGELAYALAKKAYRVGRDHEGTAPSMTDRCWTS
ncbi:MAG: hypothetical protein E5W59_16790 [Mesorhizobium sp.]|nr:MAG: hypothetical protein E5W59_16790 [Mesorhizobium sp.]